MNKHTEEALIALTDLDKLDNGAVLILVAVDDDGVPRAHHVVAYIGSALTSEGAEQIRECVHGILIDNKHPGRAYLAPECLTPKGTLS